MKWKLFIRRSHRWLSIVIGVQILFWVVSGAYFTLVPLKRVRGEDRARPVERTPLPQGVIVDPSQILNRHEGLTELRLIRHGETIVYACYFETNRPDFLVDAATGEPMPPQTEAQILERARFDYGPNFQVEGVRLLDERPPEYGGPLPVYQVSVSDARKTRIYLSPVDGKVISRRNRYWRIFDFLWMLHIMDFKKRENFNNNLVRTLSLASLAVVVSGYALWATSRRKKRRKKTLEPIKGAEAG